jgi:radical SAM protein with 4Fe4S-binding SPASM domain
MNHRGFSPKEGFIRLSNCIRLREEFFGGIVFNRDTGDIVEVDREAYELLAWIQKIGEADAIDLTRHKGISAIMPLLLSRNILEYSGTISGTSNCFPFPEAYLPSTSSSSLRLGELPKLTAPETVHFAVTYRCNETCPDCYARRHASSFSQELNTTEIFGIIDALADNGVFQLAIGGGEPFARTDLGDITRYAVGKGLVVHITTGQYSFMREWLDVLEYIKTLNVGIQSEKLIFNEKDTSDKLRALVECVTNFGVGVGANIIMNQFTICHIDKLFGLLLGCGFKRFIFLRYKPIADRARWDNENPTPEKLRFFKDWITSAKRQYPNLMLRVDCASSFFMKDISSLAAKRAGISGCVAGGRIISVAPDGTVYPCSQLVDQAHQAGNLTKDAFETIWHESVILNKYRYFRQHETFVGNVCGQCAANFFCGGCRVFAENTIGSEPRCPLD